MINVADRRHAPSCAQNKTQPRPKLFIVYLSCVTFNKLSQTDNPRTDGGHKESETSRRPFRTLPSPTHPAAVQIQLEYIFNQIDFIGEPLLRWSKGSGFTSQSQPRAMHPNFGPRMIAREGDETGTKESTALPQMFSTTESIPL